VRLFHQHRWCLIDRTYAEPVFEKDQIETCSGDAFVYLLMGVTTFLFQCEDPLCREVKKVECLGKRMIESGTGLIP